MMGFWVFMLIMILLTPLTMIWMGRVFQRKTVFYPGTAAGYRTPMSMKNRDTWEFAQIYSGRIYVRVGLFSLLPSVIPLFFVLHGSMYEIGMMGLLVVGVQLMLLVFPIIPTELALRRNFDKYGNRLE